MKERAEQLLKMMFGSGALFRNGQWEAIESVLKKKRTLVVQRTGWGKSLVYFIATKILREQGEGPTILISPLLSLMRNQVETAQKIGIRALTLNSTNEESWDDIIEQLRQDQCDVLLVSPERLANSDFVNHILPSIQKGIGMFVIDEAHCISDWGHDFRPDYRRTVRIVQTLLPSVPVLATTATANDRVVTDIQEQLGSDLEILRGPLTRESLQIQTIVLENQAERLAWLAENLPGLPGSGIIYCLTKSDCRRVATWLQSKEIEAYEYHAKINNREGLEQKLIRNEVKALVATIALGMGFDKPDLGFVVHYQRPGSLVSYYQQIGRAGRALDDAYAILLNGREDDEIQEFFIHSAFPSIDELQQVLHAIQESHSGLTLTELLHQLNLSRGRVQKSLKMLEIDGAVHKSGSKFIRTVNQWNPDIERMERITDLRTTELQRMKDFVTTSSCLMEYVARELDDPHAEPCGKCANCTGDFILDQANPDIVQEAVDFLRGDVLEIQPRKQWASGVGTRGFRISPEMQNQSGRVLCMYGDAGWGRMVAEDKYIHSQFRDELVKASAELIADRWRPDPMPTWVTSVPSLRRPHLVPDFAKKVADHLGLPFHPVITKKLNSPEQKTMQNSTQQLTNVLESFHIRGECPNGPVLLIDDMVDSGWTLTLCGVLLKEAGSGPVFPFALASSSTGGDSD